MKRLLVEFIGTFMLAFAAGNALVSQHPLAAVAAGAALMIATCFGCAISGAHFNPAVSLAAWRRGRLGKSELLTYMAAQLIGAILAALFTQVVQGAVIEEFAKAAVATAMKGGPAPKLSSIFIAEFAPEMQFELEAPKDTPVAPGDHVIIALSGDNFLKACLIAFGIPLLVVLAGLLAAQLLGVDQSIQAWVAIVAFVIGLVPVRILGRDFASPRVIEVIHEQG